MDGSEVGTKGNGIYIELIWSLNERNFIKQHVPLDVQTQKVVSFSITPEAHGDAKVMPATTRGTLKMDVGLTRILADGAYDTVSNWVLTEEIHSGICQYSIRRLADWTVRFSVEPPYSIDDPRSDEEQEQNYRKSEAV